jgi:large subunit ribosomal protein L15
MKLHDLKPAEGSRKPRKRVGRGIAAGQGKTAGRGTKGQKARAGGSIPPWFEGGQTPLHMRIPKLRGFKNRFKIDYEVVNIGRIGELALLGAFESGELPGGKASAKAAPVTVNQEILRAVGLVRTLSKPLKVLGQGDIEVALFVVADAFSKSATAKIEAAGGSVQVLQVPTGPLAALGLEPVEAPAPKTKVRADAAASTETAEASTPTAEASTPTEPKASRSKPAKGDPEATKGKTEGTSAPAKGKPEGAKGKAEGAKGKAEGAKGKAEAPKGKAEAPKGKAEATKGKAEATKAKAEAATGKGVAAKGKAEASAPIAAELKVADAPTDEDA